MLLMKMDLPPYTLLLLTVTMGECFSFFCNLFLAFCLNSIFNWSPKTFRSVNNALFDTWSEMEYVKVNYTLCERGCHLGFRQFLFCVMYSDCCWWCHHSWLALPWFLSQDKDDFKCESGMLCYVHHRFDPKWSDEPWGSVTQFQAFLSWRSWQPVTLYFIFVQSRAPLHPASAAASYWMFVCRCVQALLGRGAEVERECVGGQTALILASEHGSVECVRVLLAAGANRSHVTAVSSPAYTHRY